MFPKACLIHSRSDYSGQKKQQQTKTKKTYIYTGADPGGGVGAYAPPKISAAYFISVIIYYIMYRTSPDRRPLHEEGPQLGCSVYGASCGAPLYAE